MASFKEESDAGGISTAVKALEKADLFTDENMKKMLDAGSEVMLTAIKEGLVQAGHNNPGRRYRTGETLRHITRDKAVKRNKKDIPYMSIKVVGEDSRRQRYGTKAAVLDIGRRTGGKIQGDAYWRNAQKNAWDKVNSTMQEVATEILDENNKGG